MNQSWSIVILCYNERGSIKQVCIEAIEVLNKFGPVEKEILIIDDASTDGSKEIIKKLETNFDFVKGIYHSQNGGIGNVTQTAYKQVRNDNIYIVSGDGEANISEILTLPKVLDDNTFYLFNREKKVGYNVIRYLLTVINKILNWVLFGVWCEDINWNKVVRKNQIENLNLKMDSVLVDSEIVLKLLKKGFNLLPITTYSKPRLSGDAKGGNMKSVISSFSDIFKLWKVVRTFQ